MRPPRTPHSPAGLAFGREGLVLAERRREQGHGLVELHPAGQQTLLVERVASQEVVAEYTVGLDAELSSALGLDPVADGDDHFQVVEGGRSTLGPRTCLQNLQRSRPIQFPLGKRVLDVAGSQDIRFLDEYAREQGLGSRSAAVHKAVRLLRSAELGAAYESAWEEWATEGEAESWEPTVGDGLSGGT